MNYNNIKIVTKAGKIHNLNIRVFIRNLIKSLDIIESNSGNKIDLLS